MKALIIGITGQDGSYLAELLLEKGYEVHGLIRRSSSFNTGRIDHIFDRVHLHYGDLTDSSNLNRMLESVRPDEVYNLGAQSHVMVSFELPEYTFDVDALGTIRLLDAIRQVNTKIKYYQASTSELFGDSPAPQNELTPFRPRSPYAIAKLAAYWAVVNYREAYGLFAVNGILFNHESPRRGETFVTRKITIAANRIAQGLQKKLVLGNLDAKRDWGYAPEYMRAAWMMMQYKTPEDFVIATNESHTVREFVDKSFSLLGLDYKKYIEIDQKYFRPTEVEFLQGDAYKAYSLLGWFPKISFDELVKIMVRADEKNI